MYVRERESVCVCVFACVRACAPCVHICMYMCFIEFNIKACILSGFVVWDTEYLEYLFFDCITLLNEKKKRNTSLFLYF